MSEVRVAKEVLQDFTEKLFVQMGMPPEDARIEAQVLVWANLRGIDSHGVLRVPQYLASVEKGGMNPTPDIQVLKETPAVIFVDGDHAFGPVVTTFTMERVMEKAREVGVGWGLIRNTTHQGAMGYYALMAAEEGMAGIALVSNPPNMAPYGAKAAGVHNSPIAISVPAKEHRPLVLDMATSVAAGGKVNLAVDKGVPIPEGWALDADGNPTTDPKEAGILLPFGAYKGSNLAIMFACLSNIMAGNPLVAPTLAGEQIRPGTQNSVVAAVDIGTFSDLQTFEENVDDLIDGIKSLPKAEGFEEILVPGELEDRVHAKRVKQGIPLPDGTVRNLREAAEKLGVEIPQGL
ncbi:MAG: Ldh family oxidoreductase [Chloroflexota bacterium]|nr:Ldh family oxidoreductase [Chloroflexota bacterium]